MSLCNNYCCCFYCYYYYDYYYYYYLIDISLQCYFPFQMLSLYYMQALFRDLRDLGYHQLAVPVVAMQQLIADLVFDNSQLKKLVHLR